MVLILDDGADAVALTRTMTTAAALPIALRDMDVPVTDAHDDPPSKLYSIADETPVTAF